MTAATLRACRELSGISQFDLAAGTGISRIRLSHIENGHISPEAEELQTIERFMQKEIAARRVKLEKFLPSLAVSA